MDEIDKINLSEQTKFRLSEIIGIENYFHQEINQRKSCSKILSKYLSAFDYIDKILIVLSATSGGVSFISFTSIVGAPVHYNLKRENEKKIVKCKNDTENIDPKMARTKSNRLIKQLKCPVCGIKKSRFAKEQEAKGLLSSLRIKTPLS